MLHNGFIDNHDIIRRPLLYSLKLLSCSTTVTRGNIGTPHLRTKHKVGQSEDFQTEEMQCGDYLITSNPVQIGGAVVWLFRTDSRLDRDDTTSRRIMT